MDNYEQIESLALAIRDQLSNPKMISKADLIEAGVCLLGPNHPAIVDLNTDQFEAVVRIKLSKDRDHGLSIETLRTHIDECILQGISAVDEQSYPLGIGKEAIKIEWGTLTRGRLNIAPQEDRVKVENMQDYLLNPAFAAWKPGMPLPPGEYDVAVVYKTLYNVLIVSPGNLSPDEIAEIAKSKWIDGNTIYLAKEDRFTIRPFAEL